MWLFRHCSNEAYGWFDRGVLTCSVVAVMEAEIPIMMNDVEYQETVLLAITNGLRPSSKSSSRLFPIINGSFERYFLETRLRVHMINVRRQAL